MVLGLLFSLIPTYGNICRWAAFLIGMVFPMFESFKAIESNTLGDDTQWLTYWVCYSTLLSIEKVAWPVLIWIPFYRLVRVGLLAWLALPQTRGAALVYDRFVRPFLLAAVEKGREVPALEPYLQGFGPIKKNFEALKREAVAKVDEVFERAKAQQASAEDEAQRFQPMKAHAT